MQQLAAEHARVYAALHSYTHRGGAQYCAHTRMYVHTKAWYACRHRAIGLQVDSRDSQT